MNKTDEAIHELFRAVKEKDIKRNDFRLYAILDVMTDEISLIEARNPTEAFKKLVARLDEAMRAGEMADEEYDELF